MPIFNKMITKFINLWCVSLEISPFKSFPLNNLVLYHSLRSFRLGKGSFLTVNRLYKWNPKAPIGHISTSLFLMKAENIALPNWFFFPTLKYTHYLSIINQSKPAVLTKQKTRQSEGPSLLRVVVNNSERSILLTSSPLDTPLKLNKNMHLLLIIKNFTPKSIIRIKRPKVSRQLLNFLDCFGSYVINNKDLPIILS